MIDNQWHLIDCTWGAGNCDDQKFNRKFDDFYFCPAPEEFIYTHFPEDSSWQCFPKPITLNDFENLAYLRSAFFKSGLKVISHPQNTIEADSQIVITLAAPKNIRLLCTLKKAERKLPDNQIFCQKAGNTYKIHALFPECGEYQLQIFARKNTATGSYPCALEYKIKALKAKKYQPFFLATEFKVPVNRPISTTPLSTFFSKHRDPVPYQEQKFTSQKKSNSLIDGFIDKLRQIKDQDQTEQPTKPSTSKDQKNKKN